MGFFEENWLWRGTQSAIFYYVSCSPWIEWKYKRKRRNEANRAQREGDDIVITQPGQVQQPGAFQTNEAWAEEILMGPGPPKGWKRDPVIEKLTSTNEKANCYSSLDDPERGNDQARDHGRHPEVQLESLHSITRTVDAANMETDAGPSASNTLQHATTQALTTGPSRRSTDSAISTTSSSSSDPGPISRPSIERRFSTAMDNFRDTLRSTMRPENWNWIRYERDDEILSGFNQRMTDMWNRATNFGLADRSDGEHEPKDGGQDQKGRKRANIVDSDHFDYQRYTRNPEINDLHPPVVSRLPTTRDDAAWMMLPPPSAAIMGGKVRPQDKPAMRWSLARIGRTPDEWKELAQIQNREKTRSGSGQPESIPELSDSFTEASSIDEDSWQLGSKRHSAPTVSANKPAQLGLVYVENQHISPDSSSMIAGQ